MNNLQRSKAKNQIRICSIVCQVMIGDKYIVPKDIFSRFLVLKYPLLKCQ